MQSNRDRHLDVITKASSILYTILNGEKKTHAEVMRSAESVISIVAPTINKALPEYSEILHAAIDAYEYEVGIKTFDPDVIAKDKQSKFWLNNVKRTIPHSFFDRYKLYLSKDGFGPKAIENIEKSCEEVLSYCANPRCAGGRDQKKGLVMGDVQSGKTANYLGLINMAFDYGYKIVVLLAGTTKSLRIQTQKRTDKGVIGAKSDSIGNSIEYIGVGFDTHEHYAVPFTNQTNDFAKFIQQNLNAGIGDFNKPVVLVVKKIKSVLESVGTRLQAALDEKGLDTKSILIIDDEADYASVNTNRPGTEPTSTNKLIRAIFNKFPIASYVGYTATPFANVFINPDDEEDNRDLFPSDFIVQLHAPSNYFGGRKVFPKDADILPRCLRLISEEEKLFLPVIHQKDYVYGGLADSLKEAIHSFLINCVVRTIRGHGTKHRSMMINITRYNDVQEQVCAHVAKYVQQLYEIIEQLSSGPTEEFIKNSKAKAIHDLFHTSFYGKIRNGNEEEGLKPILWADIQAGLYDEIKQVMTIVINSKNGKMTRKDKSGASKRFDYEDYESTGARVIAIGGFVLSRGLTLEGLMTSYYSRNAGAYDTLLQMCRWFGYRPKYEDLCRIYLTQDSIDKFDAVLDAVENLREQFSEMKRAGKKPQDYGLMVKMAPDTLETTLLVTSRNKMRESKVIECTLNYGGAYADTSKLSTDPVKNHHNLKMFTELYHAIEGSWHWIEKRYMAQSVSKFVIADFIASLDIPWVNKKFDTDGLSEYIQNSSVFPYWDVVIARGASKTIPQFMGVKDLSAVTRSFHVRSKSDPYVRIGGYNNRVLDPGIFNAGLWLTDDQRKLILADKKKNAKGKVPTELTARDYLERRSAPLLVIYPIDLLTACTDDEVQAYPGVKQRKCNIKDSFGDGTPLMAFAFGFPNKEDGVVVTYRANQRKIDELSRDIELDDDEEGTEDDDD